MTLFVAGDGLQAPTLRVLAWGWIRMCVAGCTFQANGALPDAQEAGK